MIEGLSCRPSVRLKHTTTPLLKEREQYLQHLSASGRSRLVVRMRAAFLIHIVRVMQLTELRNVSPEEIQQAGDRWVSYHGAHRRNQKQGTPDAFVRAAKQWFAFHAVLTDPSPPPFSEQLEQFAHAMLSVHGLATATVFGYKTKAASLLHWLAPRHSSLDSVQLADVHEYLAKGRSSGHSPSFLAAQCQSLRSFFGYAESMGWCVPGIPLGIRSPRLARYQGPPRGPAWSDVRKLIRSSGESNPKELRARAILLLLAIYGLRRSEIVRLQLNDFDWRSETFLVRRAKRGGIQHYPIQYEVGEAIIQYLRFGRPKCVCRNVFVSFRPPHHAFGLDGLWRLVSERMKEVGIQTTNTGPHSLRHACATRLLKQGSSLEEIAEFLGHRSIDAVGIYARYDTRLLAKVAAFKLAGVR